MLATKGQRGGFSLGRGDVSHIDGQLAFVYDGADVDSGAASVTHLQLGQSFNDCGDEAVMDAVSDNQPAGGRATLPR